MSNDVFVAYWGPSVELFEAEEFAQQGLAGKFRSVKDKSRKGSKAGQQHARRERKLDPTTKKLGCPTEPLRIDSTRKLRTLIETLCEPMTTIAAWDDACKLDPWWCEMGGRQEYRGTLLTKAILGLMLHLKPDGVFVPTAPEHELRAADALRFFRTATRWCEAVMEGMALPGDLFTAWSLTDELLALARDVRMVGDGAGGTMIAVVAPGYTWLSSANALPERLAEADRVVVPQLQAISEANRDIVPFGIDPGPTAFSVVLNLARATLSYAWTAVQHGSRFTVDDQKAVMEMMLALPTISLQDWGNLRAKLKREAINTAAHSRGASLDEQQNRPRPPLHVEAKWPPDAGWHFRDGQYAYGGTPFNLTGEEWRVLKKLGSDLSRRFKLSDLKDAACGDDSPTSAGSIRPLLTRVRKILRANHELPDDSDPIPQKGRGPGAVWWLDISNRRTKKSSKKPAKKKPNTTIKQRSAKR